MIVSPILYGLVHFLAWDDQFPTPLERLFWRVCSFVVTCSGFVDLAAAILLALLAAILGLSARRVDDLIRLICIGLIPFIHVLASGFLIAESFRQLFFLDSTAYELPSWASYWPHFS
jgi:hypothetical protein